MVRGRPSGLKAASHRLRRRPAAGLDPGASAAPGRQNTSGQAKGLPPGTTRHPARAHHRIWLTRKGAIYRHRCNDPLSLPFDSDYLAVPIFQDAVHLDLVVVAVVVQVGELV